MKKLLVGLLCCIALIANGGAFAAKKPLASDVIKVSELKVLPTAEGQAATQIFMDLKNTGKHNHKLVAAFSPVSDQTQLHRTSKKTHKMRQVSRIEIKRSTDRKLQDGGFHVMVMDMKKPLKSGEVIPLELIFADGSHLSVKAPVA